MQGLNRRNFLRLGGTAAAATAIVSTTYGSTFSGDFSSLPKLDGDQKIRLFSNENPYGPSKKVKKVILNQISRVNRYATYHQFDTDHLRETIAKRHDINSDQVMLGHGSYEILCLLARAFGGGKNSMVTPGLTFNIPGYFTDRLYEHKSIKVPVTKDFDIDLTETKKAITKDTKLVYLCNPNNPTGKHLPAKDLEDFCKSVSSKTCTVAVDEAYLELMEPSLRPNTVQLLKEKYNVLIIKTFSKAFGMAGLRVGYALGLPEVIDKIEKEAFRNTNLISNISVAAAITALENDSYVEDYRLKNQSVRSYIQEELKTLGIKFYPSNTNFIFLNIKDFKMYKKDLENAGITPAVGGWKKYPEWARVSISTMDEMKHYLKILKSMNWLVS